MPLNADLVARIKSNFKTLGSGELQAILTAQDRSQWSDEAFEAARQLLDERSKGDAKEPGTLSPEDDLWQDGEFVIMRATATLPPRCVRCNSPALSSALTIEHDSGAGSTQCCVCPYHFRWSQIATRVFRWGTAIGLLSLITLSFLVLDIPGGWIAKVVMWLAALGVGFAVAFLKPNIAWHMRRGGCFLVQFYVLYFTILAVPLFVGAIVAGAIIAVAGWNEGHYLLTLLATVPLVVAALLLLAFKLRLSVAGSQPGFLVLRGAGGHFLASLPAWPGYPRSAPVSSPGDVGRGEYV